MNEVLRSQTPTGDGLQAAETARDLRAQLSGIAGEDEQEIQFIEWSPGRRMVTIWNRQTGESITLPRYQAVAALNTPNPRGGWMWTTHGFDCACGNCAPETRAPRQRLNSVKCFLHPEAPERALLDEIGITQVCMSGQLANESAKRQHARRHSSAWEQYQEEIQRRERLLERTEQQKQTAAMMQLAGMAHPDAAETAKAIAAQLTCECTWQTPLESKNPVLSLSTHKRLHCPLRVTETTQAESEEEL